MNYYNKCEICPRKCNVNRYKTQGFCKANNKIKIALASIHKWEEPCISGKKGSGTIFFSYCNLRCVYCQNYQVSRGYGKYISISKFAEICLDLQNKRVNNINLVTPTHYVPSIIKGINRARKKGLIIPIVYNTSGYESIETIKLLKGTVDIYLTDLKYFNNIYGKKYSNVNNYFSVASKAIDEMYKQVGDPIFKKDILIKGVIVRVLMLPTLLEDAKKIVKYLYKKYKDNIIISIMNQYTPAIETEFEELNQKVRQEYYYELVNYACDLGIKNAYIQEEDAISESFIPDFDIRSIK